MTSPLHGAHRAAESAIPHGSSPFAGGKGWQREMERAQCAAWFHGALGRDARSGEPSVGETQARAQEPPWQLVEGERCARGEDPKQRRPDVRAVVAGDAADDGASAGLPVGAAVLESSVSAGVTRPGAPPIIADGPRPVLGLPANRRANSAVHAVPPQRREGSWVSNSPTSTPGVRLHVEQSRDGLRLWLGIDGEEALVAVKAAAVLAELRHGGGLAGHRVASIVCNGATLYALAPPSPRSPQQES